MNNSFVHKTRFRRFPLPRVIALAFMAVAASFLLATPASATVWEESETPLASGESREVTVSEESPLVLTGTILGEEFELTANHVEGVEFQISQSGTGESGEALQSGKLRLSGLTISKPAGCETASAITTSALTAEMRMSSSAESELIATFRPVAGEELATIPVSGCAIEGKYPLTTSTGVPCETKDKTTIETQTQELKCQEALVTLEKAKLDLAGSKVDLVAKILEALKDLVPWGVLFK